MSDFETHATNVVGSGVWYALESVDTPSASNWMTPSYCSRWEPGLAVGHAEGEAAITMVINVFNGASALGFVG